MNQPNQEGSGIAAVDHVGVRVPDLDAAVGAFGRLGFATTHRGPAPDGTTPVAYVELGGFELELFEAGGSDSASLDHIGLRTEGDLDAVASQLAEEGVATSGGVIEGMRGSSAVRLDPASVVGLNVHVSRYPR